VPLGNIRSMALLVLGPVRSMTSNWSETHTDCALAADTKPASHTPIAHLYILVVMIESLLRIAVTISDADAMFQPKLI
jgi:hypothetical protein